MKKRVFGTLDGRSVEEVTLESADAAVSLLSFGTVVRDWRVDVGGRARPMVLGFGSIEDYVGHSHSHGVIAGRIANRTRNSTFDLDGKTYVLPANFGRHHLHGGPVGLQRRIWDMDTDGSKESVIMRYFSPDGEEGYPGNVEFTVTWRLEGPVLICEMQGMPDRPTPINLAQHNYYNLAGEGDIRDHVLWVDATEYTPTDAELIPTGKIEPVEGTHRDFREPVAIRDADPDKKGLDGNLVLRPGRDVTKPAAIATCPRTGIMLSVFTGEPGLQTYDSKPTNVKVPGHDGVMYGPFSGLCLEAQHFPDSIHNPDWPSIIRSPEAPYFQQLKVEIKPE